MSASVFPARAGMSPPAARTAASQTSVPRASGDEPARYRTLAILISCSPRERG